MSNPYRALCAELIEAVLSDDSHIDCVQIARRARALLDQPVVEGPKPVVDYSRVPEIATEAQIRSAAQYLVKKRNCDGDLIPAIEYAIARWGCPAPQPAPVAPTDEELMELMPQQMRDDLAAAARALTGDMPWPDNPKATVAMRIILNRHAVDHVRAALAKWGRHPESPDSSTQPIPLSERLPGPEDCLDEGWAWFFNQRIGWRQAVLPVSPGYTHWLPANALPTPEATNG